MMQMRLLHSYAHLAFHPSNICGGIRLVLSKIENIRRQIFMRLSPSCWT